MEQHLSFHQRFLLAPQWLASLEVLAKPVAELAAWLNTKIEENPLLNAEDPLEGSWEGPLRNSSIRTRGFQKTKLPENVLVVEQRDLYEILKSQAREAFEDPHELDGALELIDNIDEKGFLPKETRDSPILTLLQTFDPPGIAARSVQECLLLQLKRKKGISPLTFRLVQDHYEDLLYFRQKKLEKVLKISSFELKTLLENDLMPLSLFPASAYKPSVTIPWIPDLSLIENEKGWAVKINTSLLPLLSIGLHYAIPLKDAETRKYLHGKGKEAKWILESIRKRNATLKKLGHFLLKTQLDYLEGKVDQPQQWTIEETALHLQMHPSTLYRAIHDKAIATPRGITSLSAFFRHAQALPSMIEKKIEDFILHEDKTKPLTDAAIAQKLGQMGLVCTARTVTKYRGILRLPKAKLRKI